MKKNGGRELKGVRSSCQEGAKACLLVLRLLATGTTSSLTVLSPSLVTQMHLQSKQTVFSKLRTPVCPTRQEQSLMATRK